LNLLDPSERKGRGAAVIDDVPPGHPDVPPPPPPGGEYEPQVAGPVAVQMEMDDSTD
jgi:hypothetical protein